jgi:adenylate kinase family enzyme
MCERALLRVLKTGEVQRVVIFGPGGAGKSVLARQLGATKDLPVVELDKEFWNDRLDPLPIADWRDRQRTLSAGDAWILDSDLGPYDDLEPRLRRADTVVVLDFPRWLCVWRSARRGRERRDYWRWVLRWRRDSRPRLFDGIARSAPDSEVVVLRNRHAVTEWIRSAG